jgi:hypothetical protein
MTVENDPAYYHLGLTYCYPDFARLGYLMAHALIGDFPVEKTTRGSIRMHTLVVEKLTTR